MWKMQRNEENIDWMEMHNKRIRKFHKRMLYIPHFHKWRYIGRLPDLKRECVYCLKCQKLEYHWKWSDSSWIYDEEETKKRRKDYGIQ